MKKIKILLAEDHLIVREGLRALLSSEKDMEVVGEADNGRQAVKMAQKLLPDVIVMDVAMPLLNGLEATRQILKDAPATKVLILSAHSDDAYVEHFMQIGAAGYLVKQTAAHSLPKAIREVNQGGKVFSPSISHRLNRRQQEAKDRGGPAAGTATVSLTSREMEVLQLIAEGKANKQTADELGISIKTVEKHRQSLMEKLCIHDTAGLTRYAISAGVIENSAQVTTQ
jgi:DNA-binding NarL/FixJ family response regulator